MPKYMLHASYSTEGVQGLLSDGGSARRDAATAACESLGGSIESFYFSFGDDDAVVIADLPSNADAAALSLAVAASGMVDARAVVESGGITDRTRGSAPGQTLILTSPRRPVDGGDSFRNGSGRIGGHWCWPKLPPLPPNG